MIGHLAFGWPLALVALAVATDALVVLLADELRMWRAFGAVREALFHAAQGEIAAALAHELCGGRGEARMTRWRAGSTWHLQRAALLLAAPVGLATLVLVGDAAAREATTLVAVIGVPLALRLHEAWREVRTAPHGRQVDTRFLPRAPAVLVPLALAGGLGLIAWFVLGLTPNPERWRGAAVLVIWALCTLGFAIRWRCRMTGTAERLRVFLDADPAVVDRRVGP